jgi:transposase-like protein
MALRELLRRYRAGTSVIALAKEFGVSFEWVARRVIASGTRPDQTSLRRIRDRPAELDSDDWLSDQLAGGAGVGDLSRRLHVTRSTVRNALRHYAARRANGDAVAGAGRSDPEGRFAAATERVERATVALERARRMQASAVMELHRSGLTITAIADRFCIGEHLVETFVAADQPLDSDNG